MALVTGSLALQQLTPTQVAKAYELEAAKAVTFQPFVQNNAAIQNHLVFNYGSIEAFDSLHVAIKEILAVE